MVEKSGNTAEVRMSTVAEASNLIRQLPEPCDRTVAAKQHRIYRILKTWSRNRIRDVWRAEPRIRISHAEMQQLRDEARRKRNEADQNDTRELFERLAALEQYLAQVDPAFHRYSVQALQQATRPIGQATSGASDLDRTVDEG